MHYRDPHEFQCSMWHNRHLELSGFKNKHFIIYHDVWVKGSGRAQLDNSSAPHGVGLSFIGV